MNSICIAGTKRPGDMDKQNKRYVLSLNERQARTVVNALDCYTRMFMGQIGFALDDAYRDICSREQRDRPQLDYERCYNAIGELKAVLFPELHQNASYGITSPEVSETARVAIDIHDVLRNRVAWTTNPKGSYTVDFETPMHFSREPLPGCEVHDAQDE